MSQYTDQQILSAITLPANYDHTAKAYRIHVFEKASRHAIGTAVIDGGKINLFTRGNTDLNLTGEEVGYLDPDLDRIQIELSNPYSSPLMGRLRILKADGTTLIPDPTADAVWTVFYKAPGSYAYSNTIYNGTALDQMLIAGEWPESTLTVTARCLGYSGSITIVKTPAENLSDLILVRELSGLDYPDTVPLQI